VALCSFFNLEKISKIYWKYQIFIELWWFMSSTFEISLHPYVASVKFEILATVCHSLPPASLSQHFFHFCPCKFLPTCTLFHKCQLRNIWYVKCVWVFSVLEHISAQPYCWLGQLTATPGCRAYRPSQIFGGEQWNLQLYFAEIT
jgi:hypothetical protein